MQRVLDCLVREGKKVLVINCAKTEIININICSKCTRLFDRGKSCETGREVYWFYIE